MYDVTDTDTDTDTDTEHPTRNPLLDSIPSTIVNYGQAESITACLDP